MHPDPASGGLSFGVAIFLTWPLWPLLAALVGTRKGDGCGSAAMGLLLGPIGFLFALLSSGDRRNPPRG